MFNDLRSLRRFCFAISIIIIFLSNYIIAQPDTLAVKLNGKKFIFFYYANHKIGYTDSTIKKAVIVVHGTNRNADDYYSYMYKSAVKANHAEKSSIIIAPWFMTGKDEPPKNTIYWSSNGGWKKGDKSSGYFSESISSFALMDTIVGRLPDNLKGLESIVIAGHSAGGQFVNRYSSGSRIIESITTKTNVSIYFIVANPSSYLYLNAERKVGSRIDTFAVPQNSDCQSTYNDYKYGLNNLNSYMSATGVANIKKHFKERNIIYLLGTLDNDPDHSSLDKSCEAMLEGKHRLERGKTFYNYIGHLFGESIYERQKKVFVFGVGHSASKMFQSSEGMQYIFNYQVPVSTEKTIKIPDEISLDQNYPNPFNGSTIIRFYLPKGNKVLLRIFNALGIRVATIADEWLPAGKYSKIWNAKNGHGLRVNSGIYFYRIIAGSRVITKKMIYLK